MFHWPKSREEFWRAVERNRERDAETWTAASFLGWRWRLMGMRAEGQGAYATRSGH